MTSPSTAGGLHVSTVGEVFIKLFAEVGILRGSVIGSVKGTGHLTGATGC